MAKTKVKARTIKNKTVGLLHVLIYTAGRWRLFATPYSPKIGRTKPYNTVKAAKNGAEKTAAALGITLVWED